MTHSIQQHPPSESRLRRWWRSLHGAIEAMETMETSGYGHLADRIDHMEKRLQRVEALQAPPPGDRTSGD